MKSMQKLGGIGGFAAAATFVIGLAMFATMFFDYATATDPRTPLRSSWIITSPCTSGTTSS